MTRISGLQNIRNMQAAVEAIVERSPGLAKPTLQRFTWSRLHSDLLDDNRWVLVAMRAKAPLPIVEALIVRLESHANKSSPRGYVGDFSVEGMAARWGVDGDMVARIFAELERADIGWIDQDQLVTFWDRNPDKIDETAADRQQRVRDRKKGMKQLAKLARLGFITEQQRAERELALKDSRDPRVLMTAWAGLSTPSTDASRRDGVTVTRDSVTVTPRADQIINQDLRGKEERGLAKGALGTAVVPSDGVQPVDMGAAQLWLETEGKALVAARMTTQAPRAGLLLERWSAGVDGDSPALMAIILGAVGTSAIGDGFQTVIENQIRRRAEAADGPKLPFPPVGLRSRR